MDYIEMLERIKKDELRVHIHNNDEKDDLVAILMQEFGFDNGFECDWEGFPYVSTDEYESVVGWSRSVDQTIDFDEFMYIRSGMTNVEISADGLL